MNGNLRALVSRLNSTTRSSLEAAAGMCLSRTNYEIEIEHFLAQLLERADSDVSHMVRGLEIEPSKLALGLARAMDRLKTGNARSPAISPRVLSLLTGAWTIGSLEFSAKSIRSGHVFVALFADSELSRIAAEISPDLTQVSADVLRSRFPDLTAGSSEGETEKVAESNTVPKITKTPNLDQYTVDMTAAARAGKIDPVLGRDPEIRQIVDILTRRRQNNPILTGEAGVGKTAVVEGFALRIAAGDVPPQLKNVSLRTLDLALLQAGAGVKGEFENRLKSVMAEVKESPSPVILFIDEAHTMIGAGGQAGQGDAANLLKPALARGELRTIAATTWSEYKKYFEKDAALARRFQVIKVEEPSEEVALGMMRGIVSTLEQHHKVTILDEAVEDSVRMSHRYIAGRQLPDKSVSVLDTACARVAIGHSGTPPQIEDLTRSITLLETEIRIVERETAAGTAHGQRLEELNAKLGVAKAELASLQSRILEERGLVERIIGLRREIDKGASAESLEALRADLEKESRALAELQGEKPLVQPFVTSATIAQVVSGWTGIPVGKMVRDEIVTVLKLKELMEQRVVGQAHAIEAICRRIRTARAGLDDPSRPIGVFLLVGPSGVGKTETALTLADILYGGERNCVVINMSEYQEAHTVSGLKGSPPGYVGYGEGGVLTEAVRRKPYCVLLLDEMEKAHSDVMEIFYQVFDKGMMEDGEGREIDFKNTVIVMTSNAASATLSKLCADPETMPEPEALAEALGPELRKVFTPALLGRLIVVPYFPIRDTVLKQIIELKLRKIARRLLATHKVTLTWTAALIDGVAQRCTEVESGARNIDHILTGSLLPEISTEILSKMTGEVAMKSIQADIGADGGFVYEFDRQPIAMAAESGGF